MLNTNSNTKREVECKQYNETANRNQEVRGNKKEI